MLRSNCEKTVFFFLAISLAPWAVSAQENQVPATNALAGAPATKLDYPDNTGGLERLARDILKAQKQNDGLRAETLLQSLLLPNPRAWYAENYGDYAAEHEGATYETSYKRVPADLATYFLDMQEKYGNHVLAVRYDKSCDDNAGELIFGLLQDRIKPVPLYELRFLSGDQFYRLRTFVYIDGAFRFVITPKLEDRFPRIRIPKPDSNAEEAKKEEAAPIQRVRQGGQVAAAKLVQKVTPQYPQVAKNERLQGKVTLHAIIAKDGTIKLLRVMRGYCSLAEAAMDAVSRWRYSPTSINGEPIEVDTTIDVIFTLNH